MISLLYYPTFTNVRLIPTITVPAGADLSTFAQATPFVKRARSRFSIDFGKADAFSITVPHRERRDKAETAILSFARLR
jgi:hypothetical protein